MRRLRALLNILTVVLAVVTLTLPAVVLTQAPDRSHPPQSGPPPALKLPTIQKRALSNGLPVWIVERHEVPIVQVNLVVLSGTGDDPAGKFGIASLTASMLTEGAGSRSALEIADAVDFLGADLVTNSGSGRIRDQVERAGRASRGRAQRHGRRRRAAHISRGRARASQAAAAHQRHPGSRQPGSDRTAGICARPVRHDAPLRHGARGRRADHSGLHRERRPRVLCVRVQARQRRPRRRRRCDARSRRASARNAVWKVEQRRRARHVRR